MINLLIQFVYHLMSVITAVTPWPRLRKVQGFFSMSLAFPLAESVLILFWSLNFYNPNLLLSEDAKKVLSNVYFNHTIHTLPGVAMLLDLIVWKFEAPNKIAAFKIIFSFCLIYLTSIHLVYYISGIWVYKILRTLSFIDRVMFIILSTLLLFVAFLVGIFLNYLLRISFRQKIKKNSLLH